MSMKMAGASSEIILLYAIPVDGAGFDVYMNKEVEDFLLDSVKLALSDIINGVDPKYNPLDVELLAFHITDCGKFIMCVKRLRSGRVRIVDFEFADEPFTPVALRLYDVFYALRGKTFASLEDAVEAVKQRALAAGIYVTEDRDIAECFARAVAAELMANFRHLETKYLKLARELAEEGKKLLETFTSISRKLSILGVTFVGMKLSYRSDLFENRDVAYAEIDKLRNIVKDIELGYADE